MTPSGKETLAHRAEEFQRLHYQKRVVSLVRKYAKARAKAERRVLLAQRPLAWEEFHRTGPPTRLETYRALRGVVTHVLPKVRSTKLIHCGRRASPKIKHGQKGTCNWCRQPCHWPNRWHRWCRLYYWMMGDGPSHASLYSKDLKSILNWQQILPVTPCALCNTLEDPMSLDHVRPIAHATRTGDPRAYVRAFLPGNLQWLCVPCHHRKTANDKAELDQLKRQQGAPVLPPRWGPNAPIQFRGERETRKRAFGNRIIIPE